MNKPRRFHLVSLVVLAGLFLVAMTGRNMTSAVDDEGQILMF